jgi:MoxR-like ATPase
MDGTQVQNTTPAGVPVGEVERAKVRIEGVRQTLRRIIIGHDDAIDAAIYALVAKEHIAMIGPPGTAKTMLVTSISKLLQARYYAYLMTKFTSFDELFGPLDVPALARGELRRKWSRIVEADIIFLDEIFKASGAILNTLLSLMQERIVYDPFTGEAMSTNVWTVFAASNEAPQEEELQAVYDRFSVKVHIDAINMNLLRKALEARWLSSIRLEPLATMEDVETLHHYAASLLGRDDVLKLYQVHVMPMVQAIRSNGIFVSDRTIIEKLPKLFATYLTLNGVSENAAAEASVRIVKYVARTREELATIDKVVADMMGEVASLYKKLEEAKKLYGLGELHSALNIFREVALYSLEKLESKPWLMERARSIVAEAQRYVTAIQDILAKLKP